MSHEWKISAFIKEAPVFYLIEVSLTFNVILVSGVQYGDSAILYITVSVLSVLSPHFTVFHHIHMYIHRYLKIEKTLK